MNSLVIVTLLAVLGSTTSQNTPQNKLVVICMSGLRFDYPTKVGRLVTMKDFTDNGFYAEHMEISFTTNEWPSLWTVSTGLYPEDHGIVDGSMFDRQRNLNFRGNEHRSFWYESAVPIWITAEKAGIKTALSGWPGAEVAIDEARPSNIHLRKAGENAADIRNRLNGVVNWLQAGTDLAFISLAQPDLSAHANGSHSIEVSDAVRENDRHLKYLMDSLSSKGLIDSTNVIVIGDHGTTDHATHSVIRLSEHIHTNDLEWYPAPYFTSGMLLPRDGLTEKLYRILRKLPNMNVYKKSQIPNELHFKNHKNVLPLLLIAKEGWRIQVVGLPSSAPNVVVGMHGYLNSVQNMKPAMFAKGPDFDRKKVESINSIDLYPLMCGLMELKCHSSPGDMLDQGKMVKRKLVDHRAPGSKLPSSSNTASLSMVLLLLAVISSRIC